MGGEHLVSFCDITALLKLQNAFIEVNIELNVVRNIIHDRLLQYDNDNSMESSYMPTPLRVLKEMT